MTSISGTPPSTSALPPVSPAVAAANKTLNMLMTSSDVVQALAAQSSRYLPATNNQAMAILWALFNTSGSHNISEADVQQGVQAEGGKPSDASALWKQINPTGQSTISAEDFITNKYLPQAVASAMPAARTAVATYQQQQGPAQGSTVLDSFVSLGGAGDVGGQIGEGTADLSIFV